MTVDGTSVMKLLGQTARIRLVPNLSTLIQTDIFIHISFLEKRNILPRLDLNSIFGVQNSRCCKE